MGWTGRRDIARLDRSSARPDWIHGSVSVPEVRPPGTPPDSQQHWPSCLLLSAQHPNPSEQTQCAQPSVCDDYKPVEHSRTWFDDPIEADRLPSPERDSACREENDGSYDEHDKGFHRDLRDQEITARIRRPAMLFPRTHVTSGRARSLARTLPLRPPPGDPPVSVSARPGRSIP